MEGKQIINNRKMARKQVIEHNGILNYKQRTMKTVTKEQRKQAKNKETADFQTRRYACQYYDWL